MSVATSLARIGRDLRIQSVWDEGEDGLWFSLKPGFRIAIDDTHFAHERTVSDLRARLRDIEPCNCADCAGGGTGIVRLFQPEDPEAPITIGIDGAPEGTIAVLMPCRV
jgi:hypothetical protein